VLSRCTSAGCYRLRSSRPTRARGGERRITRRGLPVFRGASTISVVGSTPWIEDASEVEPPLSSVHRDHLNQSPAIQSSESPEGALVVPVVPTGDGEDVSPVNAVPSDLPRLLPEETAALTGRDGECHAMERRVSPHAERLRLRPRDTPGDAPGPVRARAVSRG
jgi:hypothetical protein